MSRLDQREIERLEKDEGLQDACQSTGLLMQAAVADINAKFGDGYAEGHAELVGAYMKVAGREFVGARLGQRLGEIAYQLKSLGNGNAASEMGAIEGHAAHLGEKLDGLASAVNTIGVALGEMVHGEGLVLSGLEDVADAVGPDHKRYERSAEVYAAARAANGGDKA